MYFEYFSNYYNSIVQIQSEKDANNFKEKS